MTNGFIWDYNLPSERIATDEETTKLLNSIDSQIKDKSSKYIYEHKVFLIDLIFKYEHNYKNISE